MVLTLLPSAPEWKPWETEPDECGAVVEGYDVRIKRQESLHLCGYVDVPLSHPAALSTWDWPDTPSLQVHGGVTYYKQHGDDFFRVGFDCAHSGDFVPGLRFPQGTYRNFSYVQAEVESLALQLSILASIDEALRGI